MPNAVGALYLELWFRESSNII